MTEMIDARLTNRISGLINDFISENGVDSVKVHNGLDIEKVRLFILFQVMILTPYHRLLMVKLSMRTL